MTAIENRGNIFSTVMTAAICAVLIILGLMIQAPQKREIFKTIKVSLAPLEKTLNDKPQTADESDAASASSSNASAPSSAQEVVEEAVTEKAPPAPAQAPAKAKTQSQTKKAQASSPSKASSKASSSTSAKASTKAPVTQTPAPTVTRKYKKSVEELAQEQMNAPKKSSSYSDDDFEYTESTSSASSSKTATASSSLSGSAAKASNSKSNTPSTSRSSDGKTVNKSTSSSTSSALSGMNMNKYSTTVADGISSRTNIKTGSEGGKVTILVGGVARQLLQPSKPVIYLDEDVAKLIDNTRVVTITFKVLGNGRVPSSDIAIRPSSLLPAAVQDAIRAELSTWLFSADPSGESGTASFDYTIEVK
ncbi:hypothetical protein [Treponema sp.]|uniref:hypothetical protein n=1 Tax=Treponema sp. TaxID=166 RepID=UPI0025F2FDDA|nr:hypothetical protein [Treponema sp.]MCR5217135.1 hypothetical protein [Treponema sp.]